MSYDNNIPPINVVGRWVLREPFSVPNTEIYRCDAIEGFTTLETQGINVYNSYYSPKGISRNDFKDDQSIDTKMVCIIHKNGTKVFVPSTYIIEYPTEMAADLQRIVLSFDLGILPKFIDLTPFLEEINGMLSGTLGINAIANVHVGPAEGFVSVTEAGQAEAARIAGISLDKLSDFAAKTASDRVATKVQGTVAALKDILRNI